MRKDEEPLHPKEKHIQWKLGVDFQDLLFWSKFDGVFFHWGSDYSPNRKGPCAPSCWLIPVSRWADCTWQDPAVFKRRVKSQMRNGEVPTSWLEKASPPAVRWSFVYDVDSACIFRMNFNSVPWAWSQTRICSCLSFFGEMTGVLKFSLDL